MTNLPCKHCLLLEDAHPPDGRRKCLFNTRGYAPVPERYLLELIPFDARSDPQTYRFQEYAHGSAWFVYDRAGGYRAYRVNKRDLLRKQDP